MIRVAVVVTIEEQRELEALVVQQHDEARKISRNGAATSFWRALLDRIQEARPV